MDFGQNNRPGQMPGGTNNMYGAYRYNEPGSGMANAAMVLGIISIVSSITFTVYPPFILGGIAIVLALLSKGRSPKLLSKAKTGIICAIAGLVLNTIIVTASITLLFTNPDVRDQVNKTFEKQYGMTFDEMWKEMMEEGVQ